MLIIYAKGNPVTLSAGPELYLWSECLFVKLQKITPKEGKSILEKTRSDNSSII